MLECIIDSREQVLLQDLENKLSIPLKTRMLPIGDLIFQKENGEILLMIERKSVRDLVHSLKDGRYHDQRNRWHEFLKNSPNSFVSLWIEGDLMSADMEEPIRSSLLNSLLRLQTKHLVIVHHVRSRDGFIKSLQMVADKLQKDPYHLVMKPDDTLINPPSLEGYKKSAHSEETYWQSCLALIPSISIQTASRITSFLYPSMVQMVQELSENQSAVIKKLSGLKLNEKRKLGEKQALKIVRYIMFPSLDQTKIV